MKKLNIPVGISDFEKIRNGGFYYIDKSGLITEILDEKAEVTLITRPRRFGKTLGMSMLESFFDIRKNSKELFEGLEIAEHQALCDECHFCFFVQNFIPTGRRSGFHWGIRYAHNGDSGFVQQTSLFA